MSEKFDFSKTEDQQRFDEMDKEKKDKIINESRWQAGQLMEKIEKGEASNYVDADKIIEDERKAYILKEINRSLPCSCSGKIESVEEIISYSSDESFSKSQEVRQACLEGIKNNLLRFGDLSYFEKDKVSNLKLRILDLKSFTNISETEFKSIVSDALLENFKKKGTAGFLLIKDEYWTDLTPAEFLKDFNDLRIFVDEIQKIDSELGDKVLCQFEALFTVNQIGDKQNYLVILNEAKQIKDEILGECGKVGLTSEILNQTITKKIENINSDGTAFTVINGFGGAKSMNRERIKKVFTEGLLGTSYDWDESIISQHGNTDNSSNLTKELWASKTREFKNSIVDFNIVGRMHHSDEYYCPISHSEWVAKQKDKAIIITFDLSKYAEETELSSRYETGKLKTRTFRLNTWGGNIDPKRGKADSQMGYMLSHRVSPRFFKGVILGTINGWEAELNVDNATFITKAKDYISDMVENSKGNPQKIVPVYDLYGNMHWPMYMTREEIKNYIKDHKNPNFNSLF